MALTEADIFNVALLKLAAETIHELSDDGDDARRARIVYPFVRDVVLELHPWKCARARVQLGATEPAPAFGWTYSMKLPNDWLRNVIFTTDGTDKGAEIPHEIESGFLLTNHEPPCPLIYTRRVTDPNQFSPNCAATIAEGLVAELSYVYGLTEAKVARLDRRFQRQLAVARRVDGMKGTPRRGGKESWLEARKRRF